MLHLLRSTDISSDSRVRKYIHFLSVQKIPYRCIGWDRDESRIRREDTVYFRRKASYGAGLKNILNIFFWNLFLIRTLFFQRRKIDVLHACDLDTVLPALIFKIFFRKRVVFDIFDLYVDSRRIENRFIFSILKGVESWAIRKSDYVIICEEERREQLYCSPKHLLVLSNIPNLDYTPQHKISDFSQITISYVGILSDGRNLRNLLEAISKRPHFRLSIAGFGELSQLCEEYSSKYENISYVGGVPYEIAVKIMDDSQIIFACYDRINRNHIFAAPNKYYEALFLRKPLITTEGTLIGRRTEFYDTGYLVTEELASVEALFDEQISPESIIEKSRRCPELWSKYQVALKESFEGYKEIISLSDS